MKPEIQKVFGCEPIALARAVAAMEMDEKQRAELIVRLPECPEFVALVAEAKLRDYDIRERSGYKSCLGGVDEMMRLVRLLYVAATGRVKPVSEEQPIGFIERARRRLFGKSGAKNYTFAAGYNEDEFPEMIAAARSEGVTDKDGLVRAITGMAEIEDEDEATGTV